MRIENAHAMTSNHCECLLVVSEALANHFLLKLLKLLWMTCGHLLTVTALSLAAFNVGGVTIHRLFQLPIEHEGKEAGYWSLSKAAQKVMRTALRSLKVLIIDEVSMVSILNLLYIHMRLEE